MNKGKAIYIRHNETDKGTHGLIKRIPLEYWQEWRNITLPRWGNLANFIEAKLHEHESEPFSMIHGINVEGGYPQECETCKDGGTGICSENIDEDSATLWGSIKGSGSFTQRGFDWRPNGSSSWNFSWTETGSWNPAGNWINFDSDGQCSNLSSGTTYEFRAKAHSSPLWYYGDIKEFTTTTVGKEWHDIETWNGTLNTRTWFFIENWNGSLLTRMFRNVEIWNGSLITRMVRIVESWIGFLITRKWSRGDLWRGQIGLIPPFPIILCSFGGIIVFVLFIYWKRR